MIPIISLQRWAPGCFFFFYYFNPLSEHHPIILRYVTLHCEATKGGINAGRALYCARAALWQILIYLFFFPPSCSLLMLDGTRFITWRAISLSDVPRQQRLTHQPHGTAVEEEVKMKFLDRQNSFFFWSGGGVRGWRGGGSQGLPAAARLFYFSHSLLFQDFYRPVVISIFEISFCIFHSLPFFLSFFFTVFNMWCVLREGWEGSQGGLLQHSWPSPPPHPPLPSGVCGALESLANGPESARWIPPLPPQLSTFVKTHMQVNEEGNKRANENCRRILFIIASQ